MSAKAAARAIQYTRPSRPMPPPTKRRPLVVVTQRELRVTEEDERRLGSKQISGRQVTMLQKFINAGPDGMPYEEWYPLFGSTRRSMFTNGWVVVSKRDLSARITPLGRFMAGLLADEERIYKKHREFDQDRFNVYLSTVKALNAFSR